MEPGDEEHLFLGHDGDGDDDVGGGSGSGSGRGPRAPRRDGRDDGKRQEDQIQVLTAAPLSLGAFHGGSPPPSMSSLDYLFFSLLESSRTILTPSPSCSKMLR